MCDNRDKATHLRRLIDELKAWMREREAKKDAVIPAKAGIQSS